MKENSGGEPILTKDRAKLERILLVVVKCPYLRSVRAKLTAGFLVD